MDSKATATGDQHSEVIDLSKDSVLRAWTDKFDVTKAKLKAAVNAVGPLAKDVETYLQKHNQK